MHWIQDGRVAVARRRVVYGAVALLALACSGGLTDLTPVAGSVNSIAITPSNATLTLGAQLPLQAVATDADGKVVASPNILWTVRDTAIASVSSSGVVSARSLGSTEVAASENGHSAVAAITVAIPAVATVVLAPPNVNTVVGAKAQFTATTLDASQRPLTGRVITWTSTNALVATIDASGNMAAVGVGSATITAASEGKSANATVTVTQASVASVSITPVSLSMSVGQSTPLAAVAIDSAGNVVTGRPTTWSSSNQSIATVSPAGVVTAVATGSVQITATVDSKSATASVAVSNFAVGSVTVQPLLDSVVERSSTQLSAIVLDVTGAVTTGRVVTWSSSNAAVATVSSTGLVTGVTAGTVTITATSEGKSGTATVVTTPIPVASVVVAPSSASLMTGQNDTLLATPKDASGNTLTGRVITWSTSDATIASVSSAGVVTGVAAGVATILATCEGKSGSASVTVTLVPVGSVTLPATTTLTVGQIDTLVPTIKDANGVIVTNRVVTWSSNNTAVATVSSAGNVTAVATGTATVTATSEGKSGSTAVTVNPPAPVASVTVAPSSVSLVVAQTFPLAVTLKDAAGNVLTGRTVTWSSNASTVATVSSAGVVTAVGVGSATITATSGSASGTATVTVALAPVASVTLAPSSASIAIGATTPLTATLKDAAGNILTGRSITWSSSATTVATVSTAGVVTAVALGPATITATSGTASGTATITVTLPPVATITLAPPSASVVQGQTVTLVPTLKDASGKVLTGRTVTWTTGDPTIATVDTMGVVTGVGAGTATITATSGAASGTASVTVTLAPVSTVSISPANPAVAAKATILLSATLQDAIGNVLTGRVVTWKSSNTNVATVAADGTVTGVAKGTAVITATSEGKSGTANLTVTP